MAEIVFARGTPKYVAPQTLFDALLQTGGILVDQDGYTIGLDRIYDVRGLSKMHVEIENNGPNGLTYKIEKARKQYVLLSELTNVDFDEDVKANTNVAAGSKSTGTVDVTGGPSVKAEGDLTLVSAVANVFATGTATLLDVGVGDTVTINGLVYTAISGSKAGDNTKFDIDGTDTVDAADLADSINNDVRVGTLGAVSATSSIGVVTITSDQLGTAGNAVTLAETGTTITISGATFTGGVNADQVTVNGLVYIGVAGSKGGDNTKFSIDTSDTAAAADLVDSITNDGRAGITVPSAAVAASNVAGVVTIETPINFGAAGNAVDTVGSANITADGATLAGGVSSSIQGITVGGVEIMSGAETFDTDLDTTADNIAANITAFTSNPNYTAAAVTGLITITAVNDGPSTAVVVSATTVLTTTDANFSGGVTGRSITPIATIAPEITAIRIRMRRQVVGDDATMKGIVNAS